MNINLSAASSKKKKDGKLGYGLNSRKKAAAAANVFDDGSDSEDESGAGNDAPKDGKSVRDAVNRDIAAEQEALRKRAQQAMANADESLFDYDGAYETFKPKVEEKKEKPTEERKSKYIQDLLKQSKKRDIEKEAILERKIAREQAEEDAQAEYQGKEKFVTKAYKRKLEERKRLAEEEEKQKKVEELQDVTKKTGGAAFASFYGNLNRNVAMGGQSEETEKKEKEEGLVEDISARNAMAAELGFMEGFERADGASDDAEEEQEGNTSNEKELTTTGTKRTTTKPEEEVIDPETKRRKMREAREEKVAQARIRYFKRHGMLV